MFVLFSLIYIPRIDERCTLNFKPLKRYNENNQNAIGNKQNANVNEKKFLELFPTAQTATF